MSCQFMKEQSGNATLTGTEHIDFGSLTDVTRPCFRLPDAAFRAGRCQSSTRKSLDRRLECERESEADWRHYTLRPVFVRVVSIGPTKGNASSKGRAERRLGLAQVAGTRTIKMTRQRGCISQTPPRQKPTRTHAANQTAVPSKARRRLTLYDDRSTTIQSCEVNRENVGRVVM